MTIGIVYDPSFHRHVARFDHPECPERLDAVVSGLKKGGIWTHAIHISPVEATTGQLSTVHEPMYVENLLRRLDGSSGNLDPDTFFSSGSREAALKAAGGGVELARRIHQRELEWGMAVVRPPGHHAESNRSRGFCLFNNIAVAAGVLLEENPGTRLAIVDWDVHHGNGTQEQFYSNENVLYVSIHQWPHFPGTGLVRDTGSGPGEGFTVNVPFPPGMGDAEYADAFERLILPLLKAFSPDHILVSAGFDAHRLDPLSGMNLSTEAFQYMTIQLHTTARLLCDGRITFFLEGGYQLNALSNSVASLCDGMRLYSSGAPPGSVSQQGSDMVDTAIATISPFWKGIF
jgi:acetoin utilization deacetylase AcuC-like enzyme